MLKKLLVVVLALLCCDSAAYAQKRDPSTVETGPGGAVITRSTHDAICETR